MSVVVAGAKTATAGGNAAANIASMNLLASSTCTRDHSYITQSCFWSFSKPPTHPIFKHIFRTLFSITVQKEELLTSSIVAWRF